MKSSFVLASLGLLSALAAQPIRATEAYGVLVAQSRSIALLSIQQGKLAADGDSLYEAKVVKSYRGPADDLNRLQLGCACNLKVGSTYLAFVYGFHSKPYIRAAYEVVDQNSQQVKRASLHQPLVLIADTSRRGGDPLFLVGKKDPTVYKELFAVNGEVHKVAVNSWYPLSTVVEDIERLSRSPATN